MTADKGKRGAPVVVEQGRLPLRRVVAIRASRIFSVARELPGVLIVVAFLAFGWGTLEIHVALRGFQVRRAVAGRASDGSVSSGQRKPGRRMIETREVPPGFCGMADFASGASSGCRPLRHAFRKLAFVRVRVAGRAGPLFHPVTGRHGRILRGL